MNEEISQDPQLEELNPEDAKASLGIATMLQEQMMMSQNQEAPMEEIPQEQAQIQEEPQEQPQEEAAEEPQQPQEEDNKKEEESSKIAELEDKVTELGKNVQKTIETKFDSLVDTIKNALK